jgi:phosphatidylglycerol---prolipoprotein diacylglyceryl transferase
VAIYWSNFAKSDNLLASILDITSGGLIYFGGLIMATVAVIAFIKLRRRPVRRYIDIVAVGVMCGLMFGRAGCLLNGCCWGSRCREDWSMAARFPMYSHPLLKLGGDPDNVFSEGTMGPSPVYSHQRAAHPEDLNVDPLLTDSTGQLIRPSKFTSEQIEAALASKSLAVKPAQILGFFNALILVTILSLFYRMRRREGQVFALLLTLYPITRFLLEMIRADNEHDISRLILTHNQITSLVMFLGGIALFIVLGRLPASVGPTMAQSAGTSPRRAKNQ